MVSALTSFEAPLRAVDQFGTDLAVSLCNELCLEKPATSNVTAQETYRDGSGSAVNPDLRARSGTMHFALRERRPSRQRFLEALSAGSGPVSYTHLRAHETRH